MALLNKSRRRAMKQLKFVQFELSHDHLMQLKTIARRKGISPESLVRSFLRQVIRRGTV